MKVKIIRQSDSERLELMINEFISNVSVIDIKYVYADNYGSVLIMYNE